MKQIEGSGLDWIFYSVGVAVAPVALMIVFKYIAEDGDIQLSLYFGDILLVIFAVVCNLSALCTSRYEVIENNKGKCIKYIANAVAVASFAFYFFIKGSIIVQVDDVVIYIVSCVIIFISIFGGTLSRDADKKENEINEQRIKNCTDLFKQVSAEEYKEILNLFEEDMCCAHDCYKKIIKSVENKKKQ